MSCSQFNWAPDTSSSTALTQSQDTHHVRQRSHHSKLYNRRCFSVKQLLLHVSSYVSWRSRWWMYELSYYSSKWRSMLLWLSTKHKDNFSTSQASPQLPRLFSLRPTLFWLYSQKKENLILWKVVFRERFYKDFYHHHHYYYLYEKLNLI